MKRFIAVFLICMMVIPSAFALETDEFNMYSSIFGASEISNGSERENEKGKFSSFTSDGCNIIFRELDSSLKSIGVYGEGDKFLAYSSAAIMMFDPSSGNRTSNFGQLLMSYLMQCGSPSAENSMGTTGTGVMFGISYKDDQFSFVISK